MSPFDLRGPQFLLFYVIFAVAVIVAARILRGRREDARPASERLSDPYAVALLRGGAREAARTAAASLARRGLLVVEEGKLAAAGDRSGEIDPLERVVVRDPARALTASAGDVGLEVALAARVRDLEERHLVPDAEDRRRRVLLAVGVVAVLAGVAITKIAIALERGRTNIGFLVALTPIACVAGAVVVLAGRRTPAGDRVLSGLESLLSPLKNRARFGTGALDASELALLVGVFGATGIPAAALPVDPDLLEARIRRESTAGNGSGCGAALSAGDGGGSSCGSGGSCGGGGGGCGGCGS